MLVLQYFVGRKGDQGSRSLDLNSKQCVFSVAQLKSVGFCFFFITLAFQIKLRTPQKKRDRFLMFSMHGIVSAQKTLCNVRFGELTPGIKKKKNLNWQPKSDTVSKLFCKKSSCKNEKTPEEC